MTPPASEPKHDNPCYTECDDCQRNECNEAGKCLIDSKRERKEAYNNTHYGKKEPMYLISESELDQIKNDCLYPERPDCNGCECAEGVDDTRASGLGCTFKGANILMDEVIARGPAPDCSGCSYKRNAANMANAEAREKAVRKEILDDLFLSLMEGGIFALGNRLDELRSEVNK